MENRMFLFPAVSGSVPLTTGASFSSLACQGLGRAFSGPSAPDKLWKGDQSCRSDSKLVFGQRQ